MLVQPGMHSCFFTLLNLTFLVSVVIFFCPDLYATSHFVGLGIRNTVSIDIPGPPVRFVLL